MYNVLTTSYITFSARPKLQLIGGSKSAGRVQIDFNGTKGSMCISGYYSNEAATVCREMGFRGGDVEKKIYIYNSLIFIWNLLCPSDASSLGECFHSSWGSSGKSCVDVRLKCFKNGNYGVQIWMKLGRCIKVSFRKKVVNEK
jgi:hypothetical protein